MDSAAALSKVEERIARVCKIAKRDADDVNLIAVSKTHPAEAIEPVLEQTASDAQTGELDPAALERRVVLASEHVVHQPARADLDVADLAEQLAGDHDG